MVNTLVNLLNVHSNNLNWSLFSTISLSDKMIEKLRKTTLGYFGRIHDTSSGPGWHV